MTLLVRQRTPRHKRRTVFTGTDPVQVMHMIVAALAVTTLMALDFFFSSYKWRQSECEQSEVRYRAAFWVVCTPARRANSRNIGAAWGNHAERLEGASRQNPGDGGMSWLGRYGFRAMPGA
jgi:hypothetical protein